MLEPLLKISADNISDALYRNHNELLPEFYEMQSNFLTLRYNWTKNIEISNILTFLVMSTHLSILRKRERNLRPQLYKLFLRNRTKDLNEITSKDEVSLELQSLISNEGLSIKPIHIQYWLEESLNTSLEITDIKRNELILKKC